MGRRPLRIGEWRLAIGGVGYTASGSAGLFSPLTPACEAEARSRYSPLRSHRCRWTLRRFGTAWRRPGPLPVEGRGGPMAALLRYTCSLPLRPPRGERAGPSPRLPNRRSAQRHLCERNGLYRGGLRPRRRGEVGLCKSKYLPLTTCPACARLDTYGPPGQIPLALRKAPVPSIVGVPSASVT
jgi:hypothetical protein